MIKFFRRIRQKLLSENRFSAYLLYATGEIVLVVIGILLALQINNWNLYRVDRIAEEKLLRNILQDLQKDKEVFDININNNYFHIAVLDTMLYEVSFDPAYAISDFLRHNMLYSYYGKFIATKGTYLESLSSGRLSLILSDSLRRNILDYYEVQLLTLGPDNLIDNDMNKLRADWNDILSHSMEYALVLGIKTNFPNMNIPEISNNPKYRKLLTQKRGLVKAQIEEWNRVKVVNERLIKFIENELELKN